MDDNCGVGGMYGCGEQEVGVATGCGFKEIYRFPHTTYPYSSCICTFWQQHPYFFFHFVKMILRSCSSTFFKLHFRY